MTNLRDSVGIVLLNRDKRIFLGQKKRGAFWQLPQGGINQCEVAENAVLRELYEETNISCADIAFLWKDSTQYECIIPDYYLDGQALQWFFYIFLGSDQIIDVAKSGEFMNWKWAAPEEVINIAPSYKKEMYTSLMNTCHSKLI